MLPLYPNKNWMSLQIYQTTPTPNWAKPFRINNLTIHRLFAKTSALWMPRSPNSIPWVLAKWLQSNKKCTLLSEIAWSITVAWLLLSIFLAASDPLS